MSQAVGTPPGFMVGASTEIDPIYAQQHSPEQLALLKLRLKSLPGYYPTQFDPTFKAAAYNLTNPVDYYKLYRQYDSAVDGAEKTTEYLDKIEGSARLSHDEKTFQRLLEALRKEGVRRAQAAQTKVSSAKQAGLLGEDLSTEERILSGVTALGAGGLSIALAEPALARVLGVQQFLHGTSPRISEEILKSGLKTTYGGGPDGAAAAVADFDYQAGSRGKVHVSHGVLGGRLASSYANIGAKKARGDLLGTRLTRAEALKALERGLVGMGDARGIVAGALPFSVFAEKFTPDEGSGSLGKAFASHTAEDVAAEHLSKNTRYARLSNVIRNRDSNLIKYIGAYPGRASAGAALGVVAVASLYKALKEGREAVTGEKLSSDVKQADHPQDRLAERTSLPANYTHRLRKALAKTTLPKGNAYARMPDQSYAVFKDAGGKKRLASFLSKHMTPHGKNITVPVREALRNPITDDDYNAAGTWLPHKKLRAQLSQRGNLDGKGVRKEAAAPNVTPQDKLRIALLSGSTNDESRSRALSDVYTKALKQLGADVDTIDIRDLGDIPDVITGDSSFINPYVNRFQDADAFVVASPVHNWGPSSKVTGFLEHALDSNSMAYRPYSILSGAGSPRSALAMGSLANQLDMELKGIGIGAGVQASGDDYDPVTNKLRAAIIRRAKENASKLYQVASALRRDKTADHQAVKETLDAYLTARGLDPNKAVLGAGGAMYMHGLRGHISDIDFFHPDMKDFTKEQVGQFELDGGPGHDLPPAALSTVKMHGLNVQTPEAMLAFYKHLNRDKDQEKIRLLEGLAKQASIPEDAIVYSAVPDVDSVLANGLLSSHALNARPDLLEIARPDPEQREAWKKRLSTDLRRVHRKGPNVFFTPPDPDKIGPQHYINKDKLKTVEIALGQLMKDQPSTRVYGLELVPHGTEGKRKGYLSHKRLRELLGSNPKDLWQHYDDPEGKYYAADVPHGAVITESGIIDPKYIKTSYDWSSGLTAGLDDLKTMSSKANSALQEYNEQSAQQMDVVNKTKPVAGAVAGGAAGLALKTLGSKGGLLRKTPLGILGALAGAGAAAAVPADKAVSWSLGAADQLGVHRLRGLLSPPPPAPVLPQKLGELKAAPTAVIIKGNPLYIDGNPKAEAYYNELAEALRGHGYATSFDPGEDYTTPTQADLWVGHSRGAGRLKFAPPGTRTLDVGPLEHPKAQEHAAAQKALAKSLGLTVSTLPKNLRTVPPDEHYQVTPELLEALRGVAKTSSPVKYYHGSPTPDLETLEPRLDPRTGTEGVFLSEDPESAAIFSLLKNRARSSVNVSTHQGKFTGGDVVTPEELNSIGYLYSVLDPGGAARKRGSGRYVSPVALRASLEKTVTPEDLRNLGVNITVGGSKTAGFANEPLAQRAHQAVLDEYGLTEADGSKYWKLKTSIYKKMGGTFTGRRDPPKPS